MSRGSKAAERSLPPEVAPIDTFEEQHLMFIRGTASSLPELTHVGSRNKQQSDSVYGLKDQEQSKASLPFLSLTGYGGSHDGLPRKGMTHTGVVSPAAARRRNKLAAQRALGLSSQSGKRQQRRHKGNNNNLAAEESIRSCWSLLVPHGSLISCMRCLEPHFSCNSSTACQSLCSLLLLPCARLLFCQ